MHLPKSLSCILTLLPLTTSLGINCRGSGLCPLASWEDKSSEHITQVLRDAVWASPKPNTTLYPSGSHIICVSVAQPVTLSTSLEPDLESDSGEPDTATSTFKISGEIGLGGICLFPQGANLTLGVVRPLVDAVLEHGCHTCGSVPIHFVDERSNNPDEGILTFNYVKNPYCVGQCISDDGTTSQERLRRSAKVGERVERLEK